MPAIQFALLACSGLRAGGAAPRMFPWLARGAVAPRLRAAPPSMFFDSYDKDAMRLIMDAQTEARNLGVAAIGTEHLLLAATLQRDGVAEALKRAGVETKRVRTELHRTGGGGSNALERLFSSTAKDELLPFAPDTERSLRAALDQAKGAGDALVTPKGLMLCVVDLDASGGAGKGPEGKGPAGAVVMLATLGVAVDAVVEELKRSDRELVGVGDKSRKGNKNSTLARCSIDLTQRAREGKLDPCVGRDEEVRTQIGSPPARTLYRCMARAHTTQTAHAHARARTHKHTRRTHNAHTTHTRRTLYRYMAHAHANARLSLCRAEQVRRCMQILVRRRKSNPVLIGDPGVGKTAIAEGIAQVPHPVSC
jgi:ATP-dependent Clp protease ATP-binding subunit ClpA